MSSSHPPLALFYSSKGTSFRSWSERRRTPGSIYFLYSSSTPWSGRLGTPGIRSSRVVFLQLLSVPRPIPREPIKI